MHLCHYFRTLMVLAVFSLLFLGVNAENARGSTSSRQKVKAALRVAKMAAEQLRKSEAQNAAVIATQGSLAVPKTITNYGKTILWGQLVGIVGYSLAYLERIGMQNRILQEARGDVS